MLSKAGTALKRCHYAEDKRILVYSLNEIAAEKTLALTDHARNEPRDLYDLWYLTDNEEVHLDHIVPAICQKLEFREKPCEGLQAALARKEARLHALWNTRLAYQMVTFLPFEQVFREMLVSFAKPTSRNTPTQKRSSPRQLPQSYPSGIA